MPDLLDELVISNKILSEKIIEQSSRIEFVRNEIMFEIRYSGKSDTQGVTAKILNSEKIERIKDRGCIVLNMGCGHIAYDNMINIDVRELDGVDIVADIVNVSLPDMKADEVYSSHVLEHFSQEQLRRQVLPSWIKLLKDGGLMRAIVPDAETMISEYAAGKTSFEDLRLVTFGAQEYEGDFHFNMFSWQSIMEVFESVGLERVEVVEKGRRNGLCYEMEIIGYKGGDGE